MPPPTPSNEAERLAALREYQILDTTADAAYDDLTRLAADICGTPIALVTLIDADRQWFKSRVGVDMTESPRELAFCAHTICGRSTLVVEDASRDERFADHPFVTGGPQLRFYAGSPLVNPEGQALGSLCVLDQTPRRLTADQMESLAALSRQVMVLLEYGRVSKRLAAALEAKKE